MNNQGHNTRILASNIKHYAQNGLDALLLISFNILLGPSQGSSQYLSGSK